MNLIALNRTFEEYIQINKLLITFHSQEILKILENIVFSNVVKTDKNLKLYILEFHYGQTIYHVNRLVGENSYISRNVPICKGGLPNKTFADLWNITEEEEHLFFEIIDKYIQKNYSELEETISLLEFDRIAKLQADSYFYFLTQHPKFKETSPDAHGLGKYYYFTDGFITIGKHPLNEIALFKYQSTEETWIDDLFGKAQEARARQKKTFTQFIQNEIKRIKKEIPK